MSTPGPTTITFQSQFGSKISLLRIARQSISAKTPFSCSKFLLLNKCRRPEIGRFSELSALINVSTWQLNGLETIMLERYHTCILKPSALRASVPYLQRNMIWQADVLDWNGVVTKNNSRCSLIAENALLWETNRVVLYGPVWMFSFMSYSSSLKRITEEDVFIYVLNSLFQGNCIISALHCTWRLYKQQK